MGMRVFFELIRLAKDQKLRKANLIDMIRQFAPRLGERRWIALNQFGWPLEVVGAVIPGLQRPE